MHLAAGLAGAPGLGGAGARCRHVPPAARRQRRGRALRLSIGSAAATCGSRRSASLRPSSAFQNTPSTSARSSSPLSSSACICSASASHSFLLKLNTITCAARRARTPISVTLTLALTTAAAPRAARRAAPPARRRELGRRQPTPRAGHRRLRPRRREPPHPPRGTGARLAALGASGGGAQRARRTGSNWRAMIMRTSLEMSDSPRAPAPGTAPFLPRLPPAPRRSAVRPADLLQPRAMRRHWGPGLARRPARPHSLPYAPSLAPQRAGAACVRKSLQSPARRRRMQAAVHFTLLAAWHSARRCGAVLVRGARS